MGGNILKEGAHLTTGSRKNIDFWRFFNEILCEYEPPEEFEKMTEMSGNPPENAKITIFRDFLPFRQVVPCVKCQKRRFLRFSGGPPVFQSFSETLREVHIRIRSRRKNAGKRGFPGLWGYLRTLLKRLKSLILAKKL